MTLPATPPQGKAPVMENGSVGWAVYSLQDFLTKCGHATLRDGEFGPKTLSCVRAYQTKKHLTIDGIAGYKTQSNLILDVIKQVESVISIPDGLMRGIAQSESGLWLGATNWLVSGGVDCASMQRRVYGPPFSMEKLKTAFGVLAVRISAEELDSRIKSYLGGAWVNGSKLRAGKLAAFAHNWPASGGASYYKDHGHVYNPGGICTWLPKRNGQLYVKFPDGTLVRTRQEWAEFYAMGGTHGPGMTTQYVTSW